MESREALRVLAEVTESQWGMVTSAQANLRGVSYMNLTRLAESGDLVRLSHGVYRDAGAPGGEHDELRAAWLASDPARFAWDRLTERPGRVVVSGESAASLHGIGDLRAMRSEFTTPSRRQTQRTDVRYRIRALPSEDVTVREGLPVTTPERTIADLVEGRTQLDHVGDALRDALRISSLDVDRLVELLSPLAERNGHPRGDGWALLGELLESARIDLESIAQQIATMPDLSALVAREYLATFDVSKLIDSPGIRSVLEAQAQLYATLAESLSKIAMPALAAAAGSFDSPTMRSTLEAQATVAATALNSLVASQMTDPESIRNGIAAIAPPEANRMQQRLGEAFNAVEWASLSQRAEQPEGSDVETEKS